MLRTLPLFFSLFLLGSGCGRPITEPGRLRQNVLRSSDGTEFALYGQFFDTKRQEDCSFRSVGAGWHCLPAMTVLSGAWFANNICGVPAAYVARCADPPKYGLTYGGTGGQCGAAEAQIYSLKAAPSQRVWQLQGGVCVPVAVDVVTAMVLSADEPLSLSGFVSGEMLTR